MILSVVVNDQFKIYYAEPFCFKYALPIDSTKICFTLHLIWLGHLNYFSIILNWLWNGIKAKPWNEGWKLVLSFKKWYYLYTTKKWKWHRSTSTYCLVRLNNGIGMFWYGVVECCRLILTINIDNVRSDTPILWP